MTENQHQKFDEEDAKNIYFIIQRRRPGWHWKGIMNALQQAASRGASLTQVMAAAEKTWTNKKATTPAALLWEENWAPDDKSKTSGNLMGDQLCIECVTKKPVTEMTKHSHGWVCNEHEESK